MARSLITFGKATSRPHLDVHPRHLLVDLYDGGDGLPALWCFQTRLHGLSAGRAVRVRVRLLQQAAASGEYLVATHLPFPSVGRVAADGDAFRWVAAFWDF